MSAQELIKAIGKQAQLASRRLMGCTSREKNTLLNKMANALRANTQKILEANEIDVNMASEQGLSSVLQERLYLDLKRINAMAEGMECLARLPDPLDEILEEIVGSEGLLIQKKRAPIGVIAVIYESRPNVTADVIALCLKAGSAVVLRGGTEAAHSNKAILDVLLQASREVDFPEHAFQLIPTQDRDAVRYLVQLEGIVDLAIPRGGEALIRMVTENARVPVIKHYKGVCHVYVDKSANLEMARSIVLNAKCQRPGVCNAIETLLVHEAIASEFFATLLPALYEKNVKIKANLLAQKIDPTLELASEEDWSKEYLDLILNLKIVSNLEAAIAHINEHGSHHSDAIVTDDQAAQQRFFQEVDSAAVYANASTRFTDGAEFGMGAEIGISTDKLHARGPMGLKELTTYKYLIQGTGQTRN